jgi:hypothetical protein
MPEKESKPNNEDTAKQKKKNNISRENSSNKRSALDMNLAEGEIIHYFDWKKAFFALVGYSVLSIMIVASIYFGLSWWGEKKVGQNEFFSKKSEELSAEIEKTKKEIKPVFVFKEKLSFIDKGLLPQHVYWTDLFRYLENNTLEPVGYTQFSGNTNGSYSLPAIADDYNAINTQVKSMRENKFTRMAKVETAAKGGSGGEEGGEGGEGSKERGSVMFNLDLEVSNEIFFR